MAEFSVCCYIKVLLVNVGCCLQVTEELVWELFTQAGPIGELLKQLLSYRHATDSAAAVAPLTSKQMLAAEQSAATVAEQLCQMLMEHECCRIKDPCRRHNHVWCRPHLAHVITITHDVSLNVLVLRWYVVKQLHGCLLWEHKLQQQFTCRQGCAAALALWRSDNSSSSSSSKRGNGTCNPVPHKHAS
jgi:dihydroneopterin aldolase